MNNTRNFGRNFGIRSSLNIVFLMLFCLSLSSSSLAADATGSVYTIGQFSTTAATSYTNGTNYSSSTGSVLNAITNDAQGLQNGAVVGISGNAVLTPDKDPIINSYNIYPKSANQSSMIRIFISAVYTDQVLVNIIRPDDEVDEIDVSANSVYYYSDTDAIGRYTILFSAVGNSVVNEDDYFDIVEDTPYVPPDEDEDENDNSGGSLSNVPITHDEIYLSMVRICNNISGIIVEIANETNVMPNVLVSVKSLDTGLILFSSVTDAHGLAMFNLSSGNYTLTAVDSNQNSVSRNYELYCQNTAIIDKSADDDSSITSISGQSVQSNLGSGNASLQNPAEDIRISDVSEKQSLMMLTGAFVVLFTFASLVIIFSIVLMLLLYRKDSGSVSGSNFRLGSNFGSSIRFGDKKITPAFVILEGTNLVPKRLTPVEEAIIKIEGELHELNQEKKKGEIIIGDEITEDKTLMTNINPEVGIEKTRKGFKDDFIQETLDVSYGFMPYKEKVRSVSRKKNPYLSDVKKGSDFVLCNGEHINNLEELLTALKNMDDDMFRYHVTDYKNDFATWTYNIIGCKELAEAIGSIKSKEKMTEIIDSKINLLRKLDVQLGTVTS